jgi:hypothetical protein
MRPPTEAGLHGSRDARSQIWPESTERASVQGMVYIAVGIAISLVASDIFELSTRKTTRRSLL